MENNIQMAEIKIKHRHAATENRYLNLKNTHIFGSKLSDINKIQSDKLA